MSAILIDGKACASEVLANIRVRVSKTTSRPCLATVLVGDDPGQPGFRSCTPEGIMRLLHAYSVPIRGRSALVIGRSPILGLPMGMQLLGADATVVYAHSHTRDLAARVAEADIVVAAAGRASLIDGRRVKPGAAVVDAGYSTGPSGKSEGDVDASQGLDHAGWVTPVPGGVGPMTIATLLDQTAHAAAMANHSAI